MTREGRAVYVQAVMTATVIYHLMALDLGPWFLQAVDKLRRGFLWAGNSDASGGCCAIAWDLVCQPKGLGAWAFTTSASSIRLCGQGGCGSRGRAAPSPGAAWTSP
jgi:hypothetical protein